MKQKRILIVDDDPDIVLTSRLVLESAGYLVDEAGNGKACLEKLQGKSSQPDLNGCDDGKSIRRILYNATNI